MIFNYTQPAEDAVDEALTGLKCALAVKIFGPDLDVLENKAVEIKRCAGPYPRLHRTHRRARTWPAQPDRSRRTAPRSLATASMLTTSTVVQAAIGGQTATQVIQGEKLFDLVVRMDPKFRSGAREIGNLLVPAPAGQQIPLSELANIKETSGASFIYRENNSRYIGIQFSVVGRDLEGIINAGMKMSSRR